MWDDLCRGASGAVILADTRRLDVSAVNLFDGLQTHPVARVREALGPAESIPLVTCDARDRRPSAATLLAALTNSMDKTSPSAHADGA